ncbi:hypothetical protein TSMEX_008577 [Taenia solium]|eukprot:TsM_000457700 transcript=TsM_000457700 gene=TsM_000457700
MKTSALFGKIEDQSIIGVIYAPLLYGSLFFEEQRLLICNLGIKKTVKPFPIAAPHDFVGDKKLTYVVARIGDYVLPLVFAHLMHPTSRRNPSVSAFDIRDFYMLTSLAVRISRLFWTNS